LGKSAPKILCTLHGTDVTRFGVESSFRALTRFTVAAADGISVPSRFLEAEARSSYALDPAARIEVIPNFVDTEIFTPPVERDHGALRRFFVEGDAEEGPVLFHVSNFRPVKRTPDLLEILARI